MATKNLTADEAVEKENGVAGAVQTTGATGVTQAAKGAADGTVKPINMVMLVRIPIERKDGSLLLNKDGNEMYNYVVHYESKAGKFKVEMTPPKEADIYNKSDKPKRVVNSSLYRFLDLIYYERDKAQLIREKDELTKRYIYTACNPDPEIPGMIVRCPVIPVKNSDSAVLDFIFDRISYLPH